MKSKDFSYVLAGMILTISFLSYQSCHENTSKNESKPLSLITEEVQTTTFGAMVFGEPDTLKSKLNVLDSLGLNLTRESQLTTAWSGSSSRLKFWSVNNIGVMLNINYLPQGHAPFPTGDSLVDFADDVDSIIKKYPCVFYVIENEETNKSYHTGTVYQYIDELQIAADVIHSNGGRVTNGGLTQIILAQLTYRDLLNTDTVYAKMFLDSCVPLSKQPSLLSGKSKSRELQLNEALYLLNYYAASNIDAVNIHFSRIDKTFGLKDMLDFVKETTHKPVISNEIGFLKQDSVLVANTMELLNKSGMQYICLWSGKEGALHSSTGKLKPNGRAVRDFIK